VSAKKTEFGFNVEVYYRANDFSGLFRPTPLNPHFNVGEVA